MARPDHELDRSEITDLLTELGRRLHAQGVEATLYIVGGAAIAIQFDGRRVTKDVDAIFHPQATVRAEAERMAAERGLPKRWLNDSAAAFVPGPSDDVDAIPFEAPGLAVSIASPRHLLAMKMAAFRPTDRPDLARLFEALQITSPEQAADMAAEVYGDHHGLPSRAELLLVAEATLARMRRR
ncbi:MAG: DUF6036 family nucleotidyltransferase [Acidimicrobiales bacterium]